MNMRASELTKCSQFHILKLLFPSIFCWYFRYFFSETYLQGCQLSRIDRETHAIHHILTLSRWYKNLSHNFFFACQRFVMYEGLYPYYVPAKSRQKFWGRKKKCLSPPPPPRSSAFLGFARLYRLAADGPSHFLAFLTPNSHPMLAALYLFSGLK